MLEQSPAIGTFISLLTTCRNIKHKRIQVDNDRKEVIQEIFSLFIEGKSTDEIAAILNAKKVPTTAHYRLTSPHFNYQQEYYKRKSGIKHNRKNTQWSGATVSKILSNTWYMGKRYYHKKNKEDREEYNIEAIVTIEQWEQAKKLREERAVSFRTNRKSKKHNYVLGGLVYCGACGRKLYGHYTGKNNHYFCSSVENGEKCETRGICKENLEAIVCQIVKNRAMTKMLFNTQCYEQLEEC